MGRENGGVARVGQTEIFAAPEHSVRMLGRNQRGRGIRPCVLMEDLLEVVRSSERTDILKLLADEPKCVSAIAEALFLRISTVSEHLSHLEARGLVTCRRVKTFHIYQLTNRVRAIRNGELLQLVLVLDEYRWVLLHLDEMSEPHKPIPPPQVFVDPSLVEVTAKGTVSRDRRSPSRRQLSESPATDGENARLPDACERLPTIRNRSSSSERARHSDAIPQDNRHAIRDQ